MDCRDFTYTIDELKREIFSSNPVFVRLEGCLPDVVPGQDAADALLRNWKIDRHLSDGMITYNGLRTLIYSIFWFANSNAFQHHQARNLENDSTFQEILVKDNIVDMDKIIGRLTQFSMCEDALGTIIWFSREFINTCKAKNEDFEIVLRKIIQDSLMIIYKMFYVLACEQIA